MALCLQGESMLKFRKSLLLCLALFGIVGANNGAYWVSLRGQVLSIPRDDMRLLDRVHPGDPVYYRFLVDFDRVNVPPHAPGEPPWDTTIGGHKHEYFFDSLLIGSHFLKPFPLVSEMTNGERTIRDQAATTTLRYFAGDFRQVLGIEATFNDSPTLAPELWVGRSGTVLESFDAIDQGRQSRLFASMQVVEVKKVMPVSLQKNLTSARPAPKSFGFSQSARNALGRLLIRE